MGDMLVTVDDDGVVKLWDTRRRDSVRSYEHHFDFVSDFMWVESARHVVVTRWVFFHVFFVGLILLFGQW